MTTQTINRIVLAATCLLGVACRAPRDKSSDPAVAEPGVLRAIVYHDDTTVSYKNQVGYIRNLAKNLGLPVLTGGDPGWYIRIWAWDSSKTKWVIDLKRRREGNSCQILSYSGRVKDTMSYLYIHEQKLVEPRSGWVDFFRILETFRIPEMEKDKIPASRKSDFTGLPYVLFEIDEPDRYQLITYPSPFYFRKEDSACEMVSKFFEYFNAEMGTSIYPIEK